jgi:hypothetical protein
MEFLDSIGALLSSEGMKEVIRNGGYIALFLIIFAETGLLISQAIRFWSRPDCSSRQVSSI